MTSTRAWALTVVLFSAIPVGPACSLATPTNRESTSRSEPDWSPLKITGAEISHFTSFDDMIAGSDAVVVGTFRTFKVGRTVRFGSDEDSVHYIEGGFEVEEVLKGPADTNVTVEFLSAATRDEDVAADVRALAASATEIRGVAFLHNKRGAGEEGKIRLISSYGLVVASDKHRLDHPLAEATTAEDEVAQPGRRWSTLDDFIRHVRGLAA